MSPPLHIESAPGVAPFFVAMEASLPPHHHFPNRQLQHATIFHSSPYPPHSNLASGQDITALDQFHFDPQLANEPQLQQPQGENAFESSPFDASRSNQPRFQDIHTNPPDSSPQPNNVFDPSNAALFGAISRTRPQESTDGGGRGQFGILSPHPQQQGHLLDPHLSHDEQLGRLQHDLDLRPVPTTNGGRTDGHFSNMKMIAHPPNLEQWRRRLFDVDEKITLTGEQFQTYFPHVDNIYSHRSTQRYKRKPFISHYWDCRLKGRPPGTAKSDDPNKKKRKRQARERDLCDVKIKITEYFPGARALMGTDFPVETPANDDPFAPGRALSITQGLDNGISALAEPGSDGARYYTIQRVNGNGANGKGDGTAGAHKHSIEESDKVKKSSLQRHLLKEEKEKRKSMVSKQPVLFGTGDFLRRKRISRRHDIALSFRMRTIRSRLHVIQLKNKIIVVNSATIPSPFPTVVRSSSKRFTLSRVTPSVSIYICVFCTMSDNANSEKKTYHKRATGNALNTVKKHAKDHELKLYGSCFCPFVQRVWISLELKSLNYQYIEVDPYKKPEELMRINPRGLIPALQHGDDWGCYESTVLMEYLEDLNEGAPLLPPNAKDRAYCRLWSDHINRHILPHFYGLLQAQDSGQQVEQAQRLTDGIQKIVEAADSSGPFFFGPHISFVDIQFAPWIIRFKKVLTPYRGWPEPEADSRWASWVKAIEENEGVKATTSTDELYMDSYERYAENRPNTSQVANAVNEGRGLP
ncbi:hypothetical protein BDR22DRAFT_818580 [Usnea florida]